MYYLLHGLQQFYELDIIIITSIVDEETEHGEVHLLKEIELVNDGAMA